jgi:hypothetical protein
MKKNTMYILGGVALVGLAYYLYNRNQKSTANNSSSFANLSGAPCGSCGANLKYSTFYVYNPSTGRTETVSGCLGCVQSGTFVPSK